MLRRGGPLFLFAAAVRRRWLMVSCGLGLAFVLYQAGMFDRRSAAGRPSAILANTSRLTLDEYFSQSLTNYGNTLRLQRVLQRAKNGEKIKIGVLGGSISLAKMIDEEATYHAILQRNMQRLFPEAKIEVVNGAQGATGTPYFMYCFRKAMAEDVDLVILEFAINDDPDNDLKDAKSQSTRYEILLRNILDLPHKPAVIGLEFFYNGRFISGEDMHHIVATYYEMPLLSTRAPVLAAFREGSELGNSWWFTDSWHPSAAGHEFAGFILGEYVKLVLSRTRWTPAIELEHPRLAVPGMGIWGSGEGKTSKCWSSLGPWDEVDLEPLGEHEGWTMREQLNPLSGAKRGWESDTPGTTISFEVESAGRIELFIMRSAHYGMGQAECWVGDDETNKVKMDGYWTNQQISIGQTWLLTETAPVGTSRFTCRVLPETNDPKGGRLFRIIAVMSY